MCHISLLCHRERRLLPLQRYADGQILLTEREECANAFVLLCESGKM